MSVFADTSAFYALLVSNDESHDAVRAAFTSVIGDGVAVEFIRPHESVAGWCCRSG